MDEQNNGRHVQQGPNEWTKENTAEGAGSGGTRSVPGRAPATGRSARPGMTGRPQSGSRPQYNGRPQPGSRPQYNGRPQSGSRPQYNGRPQPGSRPQYNGRAPYNGRSQSGGSDGRSSAFLSVLKYVVLALLLLVMAAAVVVLVRTKLLPLKFMAIICGVLLVLFVIILLLVKNPRKTGRFMTGVVMSGVLSVVLLVGCFAGLRGTQALLSIVSPEHTSAHIGVYVRADGGAQSLEELVGKSFGIMSVLGRENTDSAVAELNQRMNTTIWTVEYGGPTELVNAVLNGSVDAVLMDSTYVDGLSELESYAPLVAQMRELTTIAIQRELPSVKPAWNEEADEDKTFTVYISGIDSRNGLVSSSLSDVNIIVTVNTATRQVVMISTPRDSFIPIASTGVPDKLTHAGWYGIDTCVKTLSDFYGIDIDYYFRLNFDGFVDIIDALGGITVESEYDFSASRPAYGDGQYYHFTVGENYLNGEQALAFARERKAFDEGDRQRGRNQLALIQGIAKKVMSPEILRSYSSLMNAVQGSFEMTVPYDLIASLIRRQLNEGGDWNIVSYSINGEGTNAVSPLLGVEVYMMEPDMQTVETAKELMRQVRDGETVTAP